MLSKNLNIFSYLPFHIFVYSSYFVEYSNITFNYFFLALSLYNQKFIAIFIMTFISVLKKERNFDRL